MVSHLQAIVGPLQVFPWLSFGVEVVAKGTMLLCAAFLLNLALARAAAATRHFVWSLVFTLVLAMPVLMLVLPAWPVSLLAMSTDEAVAVTAAPLDGGRPVLATRPGETASPVGPAASPVVRASAPRASLVGGWPVILLLVWSIGSALLLARLLAGALGVRRLARRARPATEPAWSATARELAADLGLRSPVRLLASDRKTVPVTWGLLHASVLLPADACIWPAEQFRAVLLHELVHVKRRDCLMQVLVQLACALYWWNPLVWAAARRLHVERERACDDAVLRLGTRASDYAGYLLEMARSMRVPPVVALAMANQSQLEGRLLDILDPGPRPRGMSRLVAVACLAVACCLVLPLAALDPSPTGAEAAAREEAGGPSERLDKNFAARPGGRLVLESDVAVRGRVSVTSWERDEVQVTVRKGFEGSEEQARAAFRQVIVDLQQDGGDVRVRTRSGAEQVANGLHVGYEIRVPQRFNVDLRVRSGNVDVGALRGNVAIATGGGNVTVGQVRDGSVRVRVEGGRISVAGVQNGNAELETAGGPISVGPVSGRLKAVTPGGDIRIDEIGGPAEVRTGGGSVEARIASGAAADWSFQARSGDVVVHVPASLAVPVETRLHLYEEKDGGGSAGNEWRVHSEIPLTASAPRVIEEDATKRIRLITSHGGSGDGPGRLQLSTVNGDIRIRTYSP